MVRWWYMCMQIWDAKLDARENLTEEVRPEGY